jgi:excisionase family DNA binding protein
MRRDTFVSDLRRAIARTTPAFRTSAWNPEPRPLTRHQRSQIRDTTPATSATPRPTEPLPSQARFLTVAETADGMRISRLTVHRLVPAGHLPAIRAGRSFRVSEDTPSSATFRNSPQRPLSALLLSTRSRAPWHKTADGGLQRSSSKANGSRRSACLR